MYTRRDLLSLFRAAPPRPTEAEVPVDVRLRADAFRDQLRARRTAAAGRTVAVVTPHLCLLRAGADCPTCVEACPEPGVVTLSGRAVVVDETRCTGCGRCVERCPAPIPALALRVAS